MLESHELYKQHINLGDLDSLYRYCRNRNYLDVCEDLMPLIHNRQYRRQQE